MECTITTIIKGDQKNPLISAASIVAKVERDRYMVQIAKRFPEYSLDAHKGYGTKTHIKMIRKHGPSLLHRMTFCKAFIKHKKTPHFHKEVSPAYNTFPPVPAAIAGKPKLLLHICCAPDLTRPLHRLKEHFKLYLFWYNPNIHPRVEHTKRYDQFIKLI
ncbi:epoxyqueuosine reductase QueH [Patescibacteria group bacterium]|nr:epoxyqueuosine reductase QueH [Patescibacteria group bacterium]